MELKIRANLIWDVQIKKSFYPHTKSSFTINMTNMELPISLHYFYNKTVGITMIINMTNLIINHLWGSLTIEKFMHLQYRNYWIRFHDGKLQASSPSLIVHHNKLTQNSVVKPIHTLSKTSSPPSPVQFLITLLANEIPGFLLQLSSALVFRAAIRWGISYTL